MGREQEGGLVAQDPHVDVAIVHDYLTQRGGAERVVLAMAKAFPGAPIYTALYEPADTFPEFADLDVRTSWLNRVGAVRRHHRIALPLLPHAMSHLSVDADVVLASSSGWAHGVKSRGSKIVYCYAPARWLYQQRRYLGDHPKTSTAWALRTLGPWLRRWDVKAARTADAYITTSGVVQDRIYEAYGITSSIIPAAHPPTDQVPAIAIPKVEKWLDGRGFELCVSRLLPYKNVDSVVTAYGSEPERRLIVVGVGPQEEVLRSAAGENVLFLRGVTDGELAWLYRSANALLTVSHEDFGLTPLEAAAFGTPSLVLRAGGFLESMIEDVTAVFVDAPKPEDVRDGLRRLDEMRWDEARIIEHAAKFHEDVFIARLRKAVQRQLSGE